LNRANAVLICGSLGDDDRRALNALSDGKDHWCVVLLVHPVFLQNIYNFWQNCMYKNASFF
jgi:hypothetical protein